MPKEKTIGLTEESIAFTRGWTPDAAAQLFDRRWEDIIVDHTALFVEMQLILVEMDTRQLWKHVIISLSLTEDRPCHSLDEWITRKSGTSSKTAYDALLCARTLSHIPAEERKQIPRCNQKILARVSTKVSAEPRVREAAKKKSAEDLTRQIVAEHPEQHLEEKVPMRFKPGAEQREDVENAFALAKLIDGALTREEQLQMVCRHYTECSENKHILSRMHKVNSSAVH